MLLIPFSLIKTLQHGNMKEHRRLIFLSYKLSSPYLPSFFHEKIASYCFAELTDLSVNFGDDADQQMSKPQCS